MLLISQLAVKVFVSSSAYLGSPSDFMREEKIHLVPQRSSSKEGCVFLDCL